MKIASYYYEQKLKHFLAEDLTYLFIRIILISKPRDKSAYRSEIAEKTILSKCLLLLVDLTEYSIKFKIHCIGEINK